MRIAMTPAIETSNAGVVMSIDTRVCHSGSLSPLERRHPTETELRSLYGRFRLGVLAAVDVIGPFFVVHLDSPAKRLREARVELLRHEFDTSRCEHCRDLVSDGGAFVYTSARAAEQYVRTSSRMRSEEYRHVA